MTPPVYNDANFRAQFPAFANETTYPQATLQFAWTMGSNWIDGQNSACWGLGYNMTKWQQATDLMAAVICRQLFGPTINGTQSSPGTPSVIGSITPGPIESASNVDTSATIKLPEFGSSAFSAMLLASPPYGTLLLSLLQVSASVGPYIRSGRPAWIPP